MDHSPILVPRRGSQPPITLDHVVSDREMDEFEQDARELATIPKTHVADLEEEEKSSAKFPEFQPFFAGMVRALLEKGRLLDYPVIATRTRIQAYYVAYRLDGQTHNFADMLAHGRGPMVQTDNTFMHGHCNGNQFEKNPEQGDFYKGMAHGAGVDITGAVYKSGLARFPGDPEAWIRGSGDVRRICEERGWQCEGDVKVRASPVCDPGPSIDVADDIVDQRVLANVVENPDLERRPIDELRAEAKSQLLPD